MYEPQPTSDIPSSTRLPLPVAVSEPVSDAVCNRMSPSVSDSLITSSNELWPSISTSSTTSTVNVMSLEIAAPFWTIPYRNPDPSNPTTLLDGHMYIYIPQFRPVSSFPCLPVDKIFRGMRHRPSPHPIMKSTLASRSPRLQNSTTRH
jgi:hypothetical protein